jgi:2-polyprenyl-3-methyl-5-hydroxy-6-metoxy-1,4-benzoquinol methylase
MTTYEPQYSSSVALAERVGFARLGLMSNQTWVEDPSRLLYVLSRYKFVSRVLQGFDTVLEIGCADGFASRIVADKVHSLTLSDVDPLFIEDARRLWINNIVPTPVFVVHDALASPYESRYQGIYSLDVLEHIPVEQEHRFMSNVIQSMQSHATLILGMPSLESQRYASPRSKEGHVNCKSGSQFLDFGRRYFNNAFLFGMNDEMVHTGYPAMAHYLFLVCVDPK